MATSTGKPKPAFFLAVVLVVAALIGLAIYRHQSHSTTTTASGSGAFVDPRKDPNAKTPVENPDPNAAATTVQEYNYVPEQKLKPVEGSASYTPLGPKRVVRFAVNTWAGWAPIFWANQGGKPGKIWKDAKGKDFQVELVQIEDVPTMEQQVANGVHIGWATVDMLPLIIEALKKDPRTMPRVFQQIDWSNGGDGIVVRKGIKSIADLKGKQVVYAQHSPSHYFLLNMLLNGGLRPDEVVSKFTDDPFQAAAAFNQNSDISAVVTWSPDIYTLAEQPGNSMLINTQTANKLIADVWFARADFARDNPEIIEGLVRGILDSVQELQGDTNPNRAAVGKMMEDFYKLPGGTGEKMLPDAHWANYAENRDFFLVSSNPTNFERTYGTAVRLYASIHAVNQDVTFDQVADFSVIKKLGADPKYAEQQNTYEYKFTPTTANVNVEDAVATRAVKINFLPNSYEVFAKTKSPDGKSEVPYDGNAEYTIEEIAKLAGQYGAASIIIEGHTDASMKGQADEQLVKDLSERRAKAVMESLVNKYKMNPAQFHAVGLGWSRPADKDDPTNNAKNRRVEVKVVPAEAQ